MINKPTVLILGAGASMHLGFPSGIGLRDEICAGLHIPAGPLYEDLQKLGFSDENQRDFGNQLTKSGKESVDRFLEHRREFLEIGKAAMASVLIRNEDDGALLRFGAGSHHWYEHMYNRIFPSFEPISEGLLSIITFNYDRSLERYLLSALYYSSGQSIGNAAEVLKSIRILHVHGHLGQLPELGEGGREYSSDNSLDELKVAIEGIRIIHEIEDDDDSFRWAKRKLRVAHTIYFIGFGYDPTNLKRLGFPEISVEEKDKRICGSAHGFTQREMDLVKPLLFSDTNHQKSSVTLERIFGESLSFIREHALFE